jgi:hypothetical protein
LACWYRPVVAVGGRQLYGTPLRWQSVQRFANRLATETTKEPALSNKSAK